MFEKDKFTNLVGSKKKRWISLEVRFSLSFSTFFTVLCGIYQVISKIFFLIDKDVHDLRVSFKWNWLKGGANWLIFRRGTFSGIFVTTEFDSFPSLILDIRFYPVQISLLNQIRKNLKFFRLNALRCKSFIGIFQNTKLTFYNIGS